MKRAEPFLSRHADRWNSKSDQSLRTNHPPSMPLLRPQAPCCPIVINLPMRIHSQTPFYNPPFSCCVACSSPRPTPWCCPAGPSWRPRWRRARHGRPLRPPRCRRPAQASSGPFPTSPFRASLSCAVPRTLGRVPLEVIVSRICVRIRGSGRGIRWIGHTYGLLQAHTAGLCD